MILSDKDIRNYVVDYRNFHMEEPLIAPFQEDSLQAASYDLCMANEISVFKKRVKTISLSDQTEIDDLYEKISIGKDGYILEPNQYILVKINERLSLPENIVAHIRPRTRYTRLGLSVSSQHCNPTYTGNLYVGVCNLSPNAIVLLPQLKIAQVIFEELKSIPTESKWYKNRNSIYQNEAEFIGAKFDDELQKEVKEVYNLLRNGHMED